MRVYDSFSTISDTGFRAETEAWEASVIANGGTVSYFRKVIVNQFIDSEMASGAWARTDDYWGLWGANAPQALTSLKQRRLAVVVNAPVFTADRDYTFDGLTNYIDTGFVLATHGINYTGNVQRLAVYERTNVTGTGVSAGARIGSASAMSLNPRNASLMVGAVNNTAGSASATLTTADSRGLKSLSRDGGTTAVLHDRGVRLTDATGLTIGGSTAPARSLFIGGFNSSGTPISLRPSSVGFVCIGGPMTTAQELAQYNAVQAWATSIGANV